MTFDPGQIRAPLCRSGAFPTGIALEVPAAGVPYAFEIVYNRSNGQASLLVPTNAAGTTKQWLDLNTVGASLWPKYTVGPVGLAPYQTFAAAFAAAVADGYTGTGNPPAMFPVLPGTYTEDLTIPPQCAIVGTPTTTVVGTATVADGVGLVVLRGVTFTSAAVAATLLVAPGPCHHIDLDASGCSWHNTVGGAVDIKTADVEMRGCRAAGVAFGVQVADDVILTDTDSYFIATDLAGYALSNLGGLFLSGTRFDGRTRIASAVGGAIEVRDAYFYAPGDTGAGTALIELASTDPVQLTRCTLFVETGFAMDVVRASIEGSADLELSGCNFPGRRTAANTTIGPLSAGAVGALDVTTPRYEGTAFSGIAIAPFTISSFDALVVVDTTGAVGATAGTLPGLNTVCEGQRVEVSVPIGVQDLDLTPNGADLINGVGAAVALTPPARIALRACVAAAGGATWVTVAT